MVTRRIRERQRDIQAELLEGIQRGITLRIDGESIRDINMEDILMIAEESDYTYMRDFEADESGQIVGISYDRVLVS